MDISDRLEGNPEAIACRERYREIVKALGEETGKFAVRFEIKLADAGEAVLLVTSSLGQESDEAICKLAVGLLHGLNGVQAKP